MVKNNISYRSRGNSSKINYEVTNSTTSVYPKEVHSLSNTCIKVYSNIAHIIQKVRIHQMFINTGMNNKGVPWLYNGRVFGHEQGRRIDECYSVHEFWKFYIMQERTENRENRQRSMKYNIQVHRDRKQISGCSGLETVGRGRPQWKHTCAFGWRW